MLTPDPTDYEQLRDKLEAETKKTWTLQTSDDALLLICNKNQSIRAWFPKETELEVLLRSISLSGRAFNQGVYLGAEIRQTAVLKAIGIAVNDNSAVVPNDLEYDDPTYYYP
jgi:hypothetical protein